MAWLDHNGQPLIRAFRSEAVIDRQIDELIGIIKGVMADGIVDQGEVEFLIRWMQANRAALDKWPAKAIYPRLVNAMADGIVDIDDQRELMELLLATVGGNTEPLLGDKTNSTSLPYTAPAPAIEFRERLFCFTGRFNSGTRKWCEDLMQEKGGLISGSVTLKLDYLVIGDIGSRDWIHSTHGRKIEKAVEYNEQGANIAILGERHWFEQATGL